MFAESLGIASLMIKRYDAAIAYLNISIAAKDRFYSSNEAKFRLAEAYALAGESAAARSTLRPLSISDDKPTRLRALRALDEL